MDKGVSAIVSTVLIVLVVISLAGIFLVYSQRAATQLTESATRQQQALIAQTDAPFVIEGVSSDEVFLRNVGSSPIEQGSVQVFLEDILLEATIPTPIQAGQIGTITLPRSIALKRGGSYTLRMTGRAVSDHVPVTIEPTSCRALLHRGESTGNGIYTIRPLGEEVQVYCDMANGGWTLAMMNSPYGTPPKPNWNDAVNGNTITGTLGPDLTAFDQFLGVKYWGSLGETLRIEMGSSPTSLNHKATYTFAVDPSNFYSIGLSNEQLLLGGTSPGLFNYHNNRPLTTFDADHDENLGNCANYYGNTAWWYGSCWSGNVWGGGDSGSYANSPYWVSSGSDYWPWGAIWLR